MAGSAVAEGGLGYRSRSLDLPPFSPPVCNTHYYSLYRSLISFIITAEVTGPVRVDRQDTHTDTDKIHTEYKQHTHTHTPTLHCLLGLNADSLGSAHHRRCVFKTRHYSAITQ